MGCVYCVHDSEIAIVQTWGSYKETQHSGLHCVVPCRDRVAGKLTLRTQQQHILTTTKTQDDVFVNVTATVMYRVKPDIAVYNVVDSVVSSYVQNFMRAAVPKYTLDGLYASGQRITQDLHTDLQQQVCPFGYTVVQTLITQIAPDASAASAITDVGVARYERFAAVHSAESNKTKTVIAAQADAERQRLLGVGVAEQRKAIIAGLQDVVGHSSTAAEALQLLLTLQYFDTLKHMGAGSSVVFCPPAASSSTPVDARAEGPEATAAGGARGLEVPPGPPPAAAADRHDAVQLAQIAVELPDLPDLAPSLSTRRGTGAEAGPTPVIAAADGRDAAAAGVTGIARDAPMVSPARPRTPRGRATACLSPASRTLSPASDLLSSPRYPSPVTPYCSLDSEGSAAAPDPDAPLPSPTALPGEWVNEPVSPRMTARGF